MKLSPNQVLTQWLKDVGDPNVDPWPVRKVCEEDIAMGAIVIDPTADFSQRSLSPLEEDSEYTDESDLDDDDTDDTSTDSDYTSTQDAECSFTYRGRTDSLGQFHAGGLITFSNKDQLMCDFDHGVRSGDGVVISPRCKIARLCGRYVDGRLQGRGQLIGTDTSVLECVFKDGVIHGGPIRKIEMRKFREFRRQLTFVGHYKNGVPSGPCWLYKEGSGYLFGEPDAQGNFSGDNVSYIYPDLETAFVGKFHDGRLISGVATSIESVSFENEIAVPSFHAVAKSVPRVRFCQSTKCSMGEDLLVPDPYESKIVQCTSSGLPEAGEGLYAKRDIPKGTIVAFYNGIRIPFVLGGPKETWDSSGYKIFVNADFTSGERMNIPDDCISVTNYKATLGHKVNHSFSPNCSEWFFDHPRFGIIPCERTTREVRQGEELFLDYEYDPYNCPEWFRAALITFLETCSDEQFEELEERYKRYARMEGYTQ